MTCEAPTTGEIVCVKRMACAQFAYCRECGHWFDRNPYWPLATSLALHRSGNGADHTIDLYGYAHVRQSA